MRARALHPKPMALAWVSPVERQWPQLKRGGRRALCSWRRPARTGTHCDASVVDGLNEDVATPIRSGV